MWNQREPKRIKIENPPKGWKVVRLGQIISLFQNGIWGETPTSNDKFYPVIRSTEIRHDGKIDLSTVAFRKIPEEKVINYSLQDGDILLVASSGSSHLVGRAAIFKKPQDGKTYLFSNFMLRIRPKCNPDFLYYCLNSSKFEVFLKGLQQTSTGLRNLRKKEIAEFKLPLPPLPEQKKIAEILGTVDEAIEKVEQAIERTQRLKRGLMQELLTKGIGHKEFKDTEIGRIPKEWEVVRLGEVGNLQYGVTASATGENTGIKFLRITDIKDEGIDWSSVPYCKLNEGDLRKYGLTPGDVLFARIGATTGKTCFVDRPVKGTFGSYLIRFQPTIKNIDTNFLYFYTQSAIYWLQINMSKGGQLKKGLNSKLLGNIKLPLPPLPEQKKIAEILSAVDQRLELLRKRKERLERVKKGLMEDLLTGKRRVKV